MAKKVTGCIITSTNRRGSCADTSVMVHCRNALVIAKALGFDLIECEEDAYKLKENHYDHIICSYASFYMPWKAYAAAVLKSKAQLWWIVNDHDIEDNILLRHVLHKTKGARKYHVISNNTRRGYRQWILRKWIIRDKKRLDDCIDQWHALNLNSLTYRDYASEATPQPIELFWAQVLYWGSWRKWRVPYFVKYSDPRIWFSTSLKNAVRLRRAKCNYYWMPPLTWGDGCMLHHTNATLYIEDPHTHDNYAYPANRFYEALSYGVDIYFDRSCEQTAERIGGAQYVSGPDQLLKLASRRRQDQSKWRQQAKQEQERALLYLKGIFR